ncbi:hypothetical protein SLEP1_g50376 [Rubroshorea leprosula]|uniref:Uncharacterized protein n=1 Tax=Rubroshorea leprosula TaxID=152421 RepID=A0AAV5M0K3_9ROSI|nr:hypothetical protein SLEP1_g50376 [Rubroshorea leprosula]
MWCGYLEMLEAEPKGKDQQGTMQCADDCRWRLNNARKIHAKINQSIDQEKGKLTGTDAERRTGGATEEQRQQASPEKKLDLPPHREKQKWGRKVAIPAKGLVDRGYGLQPIIAPKEDDSKGVRNARLKHEEDELICRGHVLNFLIGRLYDMYHNMSP